MHYIESESSLAGTW